MTLRRFWKFPEAPSTHGVCNHDGWEGGESAETAWNGHPCWSGLTGDSPSILSNLPDSLSLADVFGPSWGPYLE